MLSKAKLPKHFLGEALYIVVHIINLSPVVALNGEVLERFGLGRMSGMIICESSIVKHMCMFQRMIDPSWMQRQDNASLLVMVKMNLTTSSLILLRKRQLEVVM